MYLLDRRWEVVPELLAEGPAPPRSPVGRDQERAFNRAPRKALIEARKVEGSADTAFHARNFLDCVKSRAKCNCDIETGHISTATTLLGNIAHKTRSYLEWDGRTERFTNNEAANRLLQYKYRAPYKLG